MKLTRKLIPAFAMLLVSAVLMSTASFAWFAMNTNVNATGMAVKAKADSIFLEISGANDKTGEDDDLTDVWGVTGTNMVVQKDDEGNITNAVELYPAAHESAFANATAANTPANWHYKYATNPNASAATGDAVTLGTLEGYVCVVEFKVRLNPNLVKEAENLRVTAVDLPENTGISVVIASTSGAQEFKADYAANESDTGKVILGTMGAAVETITAFIYIDGENEKVFTNNAAALIGEITFSLAVSAKS